MSTEVPISQTCEGTQIGKSQKISFALQILWELGNNGFYSVLCRVMLIFCENTSCSSYFQFSLMVKGVSFLATQLNGVVLFPYLQLKPHF